MDTIPALRGRFGDWDYYVTVMKLSKLAREIGFANDLHPNEDLDDLIQRERTSRVAPMVKYLLNQPERFYGALIVAVYGGNPTFKAVNMAEHPLFDAADFPFGLIVFDGSQRYFALDGQHRLASVKEAIELDSSLGKEEATVIFVPHINSDAGIKRTRRLFTTINRYAKPTTQAQNIAMDEDDTFAILTRRLIREHSLFDKTGRVKLKGPSIPARATDTFTTLSILYQISEMILTTPDREIRFKKNFKQFRPEDAELDPWFDELQGYWNAIIDTFDEIRRVQESDEPTQQFRHTAADDNPDKGHLLFRPVGQLALAEALRLAMNDGQTLESALSYCQNIDWAIGMAPWSGVIWHKGQQVMIATKEARKLCARLIHYLIGGKPDEAQLRRDYAAALEKPRARLPERPKKKRKPRTKKK
jgi:DNA sulfur modification protein DndB